MRRFILGRRRRRVQTSGASTRSQTLSGSERIVILLDSNKIIIMSECPNNTNNNTTSLKLVHIEELDIPFLLRLRNSIEIDCLKYFLSILFKDLICSSFKLLSNDNKTKKHVTVLCLKTNYIHLIKV